MQGERRGRREGGGEEEDGGAGGEPTYKLIIIFFCGEREGVDERGEKEREKKFFTNAQVETVQIHVEKALVFTHEIRSAMLC